MQAGSNYLFHCHDQNGNLRRRKVGTSTTTTFSYDAENRLTSVSGAATAAFVYDGDGNRVKATFGTTTTVYVGAIYETSGSTVRKYYYAGGSRIAMRTDGQIYYLLGDHLGGTNITARGTDGAELGKVLYRPWGETRVITGTTPTASHGALQDSGKMLQSGCTFTMRDISTLILTGGSSPTLLYPILAIRRR